MNIKPYTDTSVIERMQKEFELSDYFCESCDVFYFLLIYHFRGWIVVYVFDLFFFRSCMLSLSGGEGFYRCFSCRTAGSKSTASTAPNPARHSIPRNRGSNGNWVHTERTPPQPPNLSLPAPNTTSEMFPQGQCSCAHDTRFQRDKTWGVDAVVAQPMIVMNSNYSMR